MKLSLPTKIDGFLSFTPTPWMLMYCFARFFFNLILCMTKLRGSDAVFFLLYWQLYYIMTLPLIVQILNLKIKYWINFLKNYFKLDITNFHLEASRTSHLDACTSVFCETWAYIMCTHYEPHVTHTWGQIWAKNFCPNPTPMHTSSPPYGQSQ